MKAFLSTKPGKASAAAFLLLVVFWAVLKFRSDVNVWALLDPILLALILTAALWVAIDLGYRAWQRRRQASFDAKLAAREGIEDRKREWAEWTTELRRQGIDRYQLPFYLLLGEPQSGKSILLRNSDLYFPFGQNRLSGVGGTKGCDWWFTDQAVILDLAGRLFTHEGGASDEAEWAAFLELLAGYRPQCPANGVILVLPCDGLASDAEPAVARKAAKMQAALTTLTDKLQARLPVYVVLTKADKIFGFAECVHRLDAPKRHEMFGWSRPLEKLEAPFDVVGAQGGFQGVVERARLLRSQMLATARLPEAQGEVDRFYAFPEELAALWPTLSLYLQRVFTESRLIDRLFFRGFYLTSGLQSGAPIAKVCAELMGTTGEADRRNLEGLFVKQRAYFIKDLVRERIFTEQGLVRPTKQRVVRARRNARVAYGVAGAGALLSLLWTSTVVAKESSAKTVQQVRHGLEDISAARDRGDAVEMASAVEQLDRVVESLPPGPWWEAKDEWEGFLDETREHLVPMLAGEATRDFAGWRDPVSFDEFEAQLRLAELLLSPSTGTNGTSALLAFLRESRGWTQPVEEGDWPLDLQAADKEEVRKRADRLWNGTLDASSGWAKAGPLGVVLACRELFGSGQTPRLSTQDSCEKIRRTTNALDLLARSRDFVERKKDGSGTVTRESVLRELDDLVQARDASLRLGGEWAQMRSVRETISAGDRLEVPRGATELLANEPLLAICRPSFLALVPARLPDDLRTPQPPANDMAAEYFQAKLKCAGHDYANAFGDTTRLRARLRIGPEHAFDASLSGHLGSMAAALSAFPESEWLRHVERLVDEYEAALLQSWNQDLSGLEGELERHLDPLGLRLVTPAREEWLDSIVALLARRLGASVPDAAAEFDRLSDRGNVAEFAHPLRSVAGELRRELPAPDELSRRLVDARAAANEPPPTGAGAFVELCFRALCERAFDARIRPAFEDELSEQIGGRGSQRALVTALWEGGDADLKYFDRGEAFDQLRERYRLGAARPLGGKEATPPAPRAEWTFAEFKGSRSEPNWEAVGFLLELQTFLLAGDLEGKRVADATVKVEVKCDQESPAFSVGGKGFFYLHGGTAWDYDFISKTKKMKALSVPWRFGAARELRFRWCNGEKDHPDDLSVRQSGVLAPLMLAWRSSRSSDGDWRFQEALENGLEARLSIHFDRELPQRPPSRPFADE